MPLPAPAAGDDPARARILVIEDDSNDQDLLIRQLHKSGIKEPVLCIEDGGDALELVRTGARKLSAVCAIFLDLSLPGVNGILLLEAIRSNVQTALLPVFVLTGSSNPQDEAECRRLGVTSFIPKGLLALPSFWPAITEVFRSSKAASDNAVEAGELQSGTKP